MSSASSYAFYNAASTALSNAAYKNALVALFFLFYFEVGHSCVSSHDYSRGCVRLARGLWALLACPVLSGSLFLFASCVWQGSVHGRAGHYKKRRYVCHAFMQGCRDVGETAPLPAATATHVERKRALAILGSNLAAVRSLRELSWDPPELAVFEPGAMEVRHLCALCGYSQTAAA